MKTTKSIAILTLLCVISLAAVLSVASASPVPDAKAAQVITTDVPLVGPGFATEVTQFAPAQTVFIEYNIAQGKTAEISVIDESLNVVMAPVTVSGEGELSFVPPTNGYYYVKVDGIMQITIASASFFVVPESAFGALAALGAGVAAFGLIKMKKVKINFF